MYNEPKICACAIGLPIRIACFMPLIPGDVVAPALTRACERSACRHRHGPAALKTSKAGVNRGTKEDWQGAIGIDWMSVNEMANAVPPAYAEFIGRAALARIANKTHGISVSLPLRLPARLVSPC